MKSASELHEWLRQELPRGEQLELWGRPLGGLPHRVAMFRDALRDCVDELAGVLSHACWFPSAPRDEPTIHALFLYGESSDVPIKRVHVVAALAESAASPPNLQTVAVQSLGVALLAPQLPSPGTPLVQKITNDVSKAQRVVALERFDRERDAWEREWA